MERPLIYMLVLLVLCAGNSEAATKTSQETQQKRFFWGIGIGFSYPTEDWAEYFTVGLGANAGGGYQLIKRRNFDFELVSNLAAYIFFNETNYSGSSWSRFVLAADGRFNIKSFSPIIFFLQGGVGAYWDISEFYDYQLLQYEKEFNLGFGPRIGFGFAYKFIEVKCIYHMEKNPMLSLILSAVVGRSN
ncbi:MAG: hypothetical protein GF421_11465 [Candidatus Aminicenantes bacterium]|nr:hypothetical protein [Candidatus Aminicenantes bacterium]